MSDVLSPAQRSYCMSRIRGKNTKPEYIVRKGLFALGFRYRLHVRSLPGCPDLVFPKYRAVVFVHGCLWHRHNCKLFQWPKTNAAFWREKIIGNSRRDKRHLRELKADGWRVLTLWECTLRKRHTEKVETAIARVARWLWHKQRDKRLK